MKYRRELKYLLSEYTATLLRVRVSAVMKPDSHSNGIYIVNNLYLDDRFDTFYYQKYLGQVNRDKYRFRYYNNDLSFIVLERKHKDGILSYKEKIPVTIEQFMKIKAGDIDWIHEEDAPLWRKLSVVHRLRSLRPTAYYAYKREAYVYEPGNIRFTFDSPIYDPGNGSSNLGYDPLSSTYSKVEYFPLLLEVKYSGFVPEIIKRMLNGFPLSHVAVSKYCIARERGFLPYGKV